MNQYNEANQNVKEAENKVQEALNSKEGKQVTEEVEAETEKLKNDAKLNATTTENLSAMRLQSVWLTEDDIKKLYKRWKENISKKDVVDLVTSLKDPYLSDIVWYIKKNDIEWMQKYLNGKIEDWKINKEELEKYLKDRGIRLNSWKILEDWKFGPQTLYTMKFIIEEVQEGWKEKNKEGGNEKKEDKERPDLSWIPEEMAKVIDEVRATDVNTDRLGRRWKGTPEDWSPERNLKDGAPWDNNWNVDLDSWRVSIATWGKKLNGDIDSHVPGNRCELDMKNGIIYVICDKYEYEFPVKLNGGLEMDANWYPKDTEQNRMKIKAFTRVWNLMNYIKAHYVFNWGRHGFEQKRGKNLEFNDGDFVDTDILTSDGFEKINKDYASVWMKFEKGEINELAALCNAMKYDIGWVSIDELDEGLYQEDIDRMKPYSRNFGNKKTS